MESYDYTREELKQYLPELVKKIAGKYGLDTKGSNELLIKRILDHQKKLKQSIVVKFESKYDEDKEWTEDNTNPYIHLEDPEKDINNQRYPSEIVIPMKKIRIVYNYPLGHEVIYEYIADKPNGFTRVGLASAVANGYQRIYQEEEEVVGDPGTVNEIMLNRATSVGPHGIWGHYLGDLDLAQVRQLDNDLFELSVDS